MVPAPPGRARPSSRKRPWPFWSGRRCLPLSPSADPEAPLLSVSPGTLAVPWPGRGRGRGPTGGWMGTQQMGRRADPERDRTGAHGFLGARAWLLPSPGALLHPGRWGAWRRRKEQTPQRPSGRALTTVIDTRGWGSPRRAAEEAEPSAHPLPLPSLLGVRVEARTSWGLWVDQLWPG